MSPTDLATMWSSLQLQLDAHRPRPSSAAPPSRSPSPPVPVCLLTGFLGAGKSTLLAALLGGPPDGLVVRAIVNDVGSLPFDPTLIAAANDVRVELSNGCGCCEQTTELASTLAELAAGSGVDLIVLEASGAADPLALAQIVEANPRLTLERIVAVVDGSAMLHQPGEASAIASIVSRQLDAAHCVVLTHADRLEEAELAQVLDNVAHAVPGRVVQPSCRADPATDLLVPTGRRGARPLPQNGAAPHDLFTITIVPSVDVGADRLGAALAGSRPGVLRVKGRVALDGVPHLVQMTPSSLALVPGDDGACGITLVAMNESAARPLIDLLSDHG